MSKGFEDILVGFETEKFPVHACTQQNEREPDVHDSDEIYLVAIVDKRFPGVIGLEHARPYTARDLDDPTKLLYGWAQVDFDGWIDHKNHSIHGDANRVVAWKRVEHQSNFLACVGDWEEVDPCYGGG